MEKEILVESENLLQKPFYFLLNKKYKDTLLEKSIKKEKSLKNVAKKVGCSPETLRQHKKLSNRYVGSEILKVLIELSDMPSRAIEKNIIAVKRGCSNRNVEIKLPIKKTPELALLLAKAYGDGSILSDWRFHYTNNQIDLINEVINAVEKSIGKTRSTLHKREDRGVYEIKFSPVIGFILHSLGGIRGYKISQRFGVPKWIREGNKQIRASFLRGIFDDEAAADYNQKRRTRRVIFAMGKKQIYKQSLIKFMKQIKELLATFGIQTGKICTQEIYRDRIMLRFGIYRKQSFENFLHNVGFTHKKKAKIIKDMINSYTDIHKSKKIILEAIARSPKPLTTKEISTITKLKYATIKFHVRDLFDQLMIDRIEDKPRRWF